MPAATSSKPIPAAARGPVVKLTRDQVLASRHGALGNFPGPDLYAPEPAPAEARPSGPAAPSPYPA